MSCFALHLHTLCLGARNSVWLQVVYKRYASLYFVMGIDMGDNELITLEIIHHYVEVLDRYFGNVCELDLIFNFHKVLQQSTRPLRCSAWHT